MFNSSKYRGDTKLFSLTEVFRSWRDRNHQRKESHLRQRELGKEILNNNIQAINKLLEAGANPEEWVMFVDHEWQSGLMLAVTNGTAESLDAMLTYSGNPNFMTDGPYGGGAGYYKKSLLYLAVEREKFGHAKLLLSHPKIDRELSGGHRDYIDSLNYEDVEYCSPAQLALSSEKGDIAALFSDITPQSSTLDP